MIGFSFSIAALLCLSTKASSPPYNIACYQDLLNSSTSATGAPLECFSGSTSCIRIYDEQKDTVLRACQTAKCKENGRTSTKAVCSSALGNSGKSREECCCYGNGCNGKDVGEPLEDVPSPPRTKCYNAYLVNVSDPYEMWRFERFERPEECPPWTSSCRSTYDIEQSLATWSCDSEPCPQNSTSSTCEMDPYDQGTEKCCCRGDGCNKYLGKLVEIGKRHRITLESVVAQRINQYYSEQAMPAERKFLEEVVKHVHAHLERPKTSNRNKDF